jgi:hypothetical protein
MAHDRVVLVRVLNLERETAYFNADALGLLTGDHCVVDHGGLRLGVMLSELEAGGGLSEQLERVIRTATAGDMRDLAARFGTRIELRQMGARDEARLKGGIGRCGLLICCHRYLHDPKPIRMELAYDQELFVSPERITGVCGRLMCCLAYEHDTYRSELATLPKLGALVEWEGKSGKIISHNIFRRTITVLTEAHERLELDAGAVTVVRPGRKRKR